MATNPPSLPPEASPALRYAEFFGHDARNRLAEDLRFFYRDEDFRLFQVRLEYSTVFGDNCAPELRYGLFCVYSGHKAADWIDTKGPAGHDVQQLIEILSPITPEFAVAVDCSHSRDRVKLYFMRLLSPIRGETDIQTRINEAAHRLGIGPCFAPGFDPGTTGIFSVDYYRNSSQHEVKLYHWGFDDWQGKARLSLESLGIRSRYADRFFAFIADRPSRDAIFCHRYVPGTLCPTGFAIHHPVDNGQKSSIETFLKELLPDAHARCWEPLRLAEESGGRVLVGHFGLSFSLHPPSERLHLYFNVV